MDSGPTLDAADLNQLSDKDKADLRQFISNEQQRTRIQSRESFLPSSTPLFMLLCSTSLDLPLSPSIHPSRAMDMLTDGSLRGAETHVLTDICWKKCVAGAVRSGSLERSEETCLANCVDRFLDVNLLTMKHLASLRQH